MMQSHYSSQPSVNGFGIQAKVIALAAIFGVLPVLLVGSHAYRIANESMTRNISSEKIAEAELLSNQLSRFLQDQLVDVQTVARVAGNVIEEVKTHHAQASLKAQQAAANEELEQQLTDFARNYNIYSHIGLYDLQGEQITGTRGSTKEGNQKNLPYFQQVLNTGFSAISEPIATTAGLDSFSIYMAAPVKQDVSGKIIAIVVAKIPAQFVGNAIFGTVSLQEGTGYNMIDSSGRVFQNFNVAERDSLGYKISAEVSRFLAVDTQRKSQAWVDNTDEGEVLQAYAPMNFTPIRKQGLLNWSVITSTNAAVAFAPQRKLLTTISLGTLLTAVLGTMLAATIANRAIRPVLRATAAVEKLGQGELDTRIKIRGTDELAILGANINQMAERIQNLLSTVNQNAEQLVRQNNVLTILARNDGLIEGNAKFAAIAFTEAIAQTLAVSRVSVWLYNLTRNGIVCLDLYESKLPAHSEGKELNAIDFPAYFIALEQDRPIIAHNAHQDPATQEFSASYLTPLGITSILDVPIRSAGRVVGVIRCEHTQVQRQWQAAEVSFATSIANLMSLALEGELLQQEVGNLLAVVSAVEDGDLTLRAQVNDRTTGLVADTFNRLLEQLGEVLSQVLSTAQQVFVGSTRLEELAQTVSTNAVTQAQGVTQVLQLTKQVEQSAQSSVLAVNHSNQSLVKARSAVEQGQVAIKNMTQGTEMLSQGTDRIIQKMKALGEFVGLADQFVQDQSQIASLTQVLALNATLVAARASEQRDPRQFSVVAREFEAIAAQVSNLAQQTNDGLVSLQQRTDQIHTVVSAIDAEVQGLGGLVSSFTMGVEQSNQVFTNVRTITGQVVEAGAGISQSSQEIVQASESTAQAMHDIATLAERTAQLTQSTRRQSEQMQHLSRQLLGSIQFFRLSELQEQLPPDLSPADREVRSRNC